MHGLVFGALCVVVRALHPRSVQSPGAPATNQATNMPKTKQGSKPGTWLGFEGLWLAIATICLRTPPTKTFKKRFFLIRVERDDYLSFHVFVFLGGGFLSK